MGDTILIFLYGILIGLLASIPLGPVGVLCIQRTINKRFTSGFVSGLGAATADTIFAMIALFFYAIVLPYIEKHIQLIKIVGGLLIIIIGLKLFFSKNSSHLRRNRQSKSALVKDFFSILGLTISNPAYILVFFGWFAAFKIGDLQFTLLTHILMILGVLLGAATWWFILTFSVNMLRRKFTAKHIFYINKVAGIVISVLGLGAILTAFIKDLNF